MVQSRLELHDLLLGVAQHVYFQPPTNTSMAYPCIVYEWSTGKTDYADDEPYRFLKRYSVTVIDQNPDSPIPDLVAALPTSSMSRRFVADNLYHTVFNLYF